MAVHAQIIPSIAAGIARLGNAQSMSLREKLDIVARHGLSNNSSQKQHDAEAYATGEVKKRLWSLCQTRIRAEPLIGLQARKKTDENMIEEPPSLPGIPPSVLLEHSNSLDRLDQFKHNDPLVDMGSYTLMTEHGLYSEMAEEVLNDPDFFETHGLPHSNESYETGDGELSSDDGTNGLEADYFYTDGHGNVYPVETRAVLEADEIEWPSTPQPLELEGFNHDAEEVELYADENTTQPFIMYHEVQQWPIASGVPVHTQDAAGQTWSRSGPDESLWFGRSAGT